jgi:hypothetical protein
VSELFAAVCSIAPTRRRRYFWAAWWTGAPTREPFRKPDASNGGARTREEALREADRAAGRGLVTIEPGWARAWAAILAGQPPFTGRGAPDPRTASPGAPPVRGAEGDRTSIWSTLGLTARASSAEIKAAYHARALETHPDRGGDPEAFRQVQLAYEQALRRRARKPRPAKP